ncbi:hypothetical protein RUND412_000262 [Rhizina undulata]
MSSNSTNAPPPAKWPPLNINALDDLQKYLFSDEPWSFEKAKYLSDKRDGIEGITEPMQLQPGTDVDSDPDPNWLLWRPLNVDNMDGFETYLLGEEPWSFEKAQGLLDTRNEAEKRAETGESSVDAAPGRKKSILQAKHVAATVASSTEEMLLENTFTDPNTDQVMTRAVSPASTAVNAAEKPKTNINQNKSTVIKLQAAAQPAKEPFQEKTPAEATNMISRASGNGIHKAAQSSSTVNTTTATNPVAASRVHKTSLDRMETSNPGSQSESLSRAPNPPPTASQPTPQVPATTYQEAPPRTTTTQPSAGFKFGSLVIKGGIWNTAPGTDIITHGTKRAFNEDQTESAPATKRRIESEASERSQSQSQRERSASTHTQGYPTRARESTSGQGHNNGYNNYNNYTNYNNNDGNYNGNYNGGYNNGGRRTGGQGERYRQGEWSGYRGNRGNGNGGYRGRR